MYFRHPCTRLHRSVCFFLFLILSPHSIFCDEPRPNPPYHPLLSLPSCIVQWNRPLHILIHFVSNFLISLSLVYCFFGQSIRFAIPPFEDTCSPSFRGALVLLPPSHKFANSHAHTHTHTEREDAS